MIVMYDTVTVDTVPHDPPAVAGYVGGSWPTYNALVRKFPRAHHLSIAVNAGEDAACLDVEPGDAVISQAPAWVRRQQARGVRRPALYISVSSATALIGALERNGIARDQIRLWTAHYTYHPHLCGPYCGFGDVHADATQWTDRALGRNLDESLCRDEFFGAPAPPPKPADPHHYEWYPEEVVTVGKQRLSERLVAQRYDQLRARPALHRAELRKLRDACSALASRILTYAYEDADAKGNPQMNVHHREWRFWQLTSRAQGQRLG